MQTYELAGENRPIIVEALTETLSIRKGGLYQFCEYPPEYDRRGNQLRTEGTIEGIGGVAPCCVCYPKSHVRVIELDPPAYLDWL